jgi:23S rRNA (cytidine1920-2'-O)/16S rRNA (cytidine1409-2'-O)-methyltransferase
LFKSFLHAISKQENLPVMKFRLDRLLVDRGLAASRERAQAIILAGRVLVNGQKIEKAGSNVEQGAEIRLLGEEMKYVGRGGLKLEAALRHWQIDLNGRTCLDVGASTGGFTDCMLQHGAAEVIAVDTGYGQIAARLRSDARVKLMEKTNARYLTAEQLRQSGADSSISFIAMDVSFISVTLVFPAVFRAAFAGPERKHRDLVVLVKPQFEVGRELVGKGGIVKDPQAQEMAVEKVREIAKKLGGGRLEVIESPILGREGNREFLLHAEF